MSIRVVSDRRIVILICSFFFLFISCSKRNEGDRNENFDKNNIVDLESLMDQYLLLLNQQPNNVFTDIEIAYPVTEMTGMLMYWKISGKKEFYYAAQRQKEICLSYLTYNNLPKYSWYAYHTRDMIARDIVMWYLAYKITDDISYLRIAERIALSFKQLERKVKCFEGSVFPMFGREYDTLSLAYVAGGSIDPNQNMEIALAFGYLYNEPLATIKGGGEFDWYQNESLMEIISSEIKAALLLRDAEGRFYMEEGAPNHVFDTAYWEYTTVLMMMYYEISSDKEIYSAIAKSGNALKKYHSNIDDVYSLYDKSDNSYANRNNGDDLFTRTMIFDYLGLEKPKGWNEFVYGRSFFNENGFPINCISKDVKPIYMKMALLSKFFLYPYFCGMPIINLPLTDS